VKVEITGNNNLGIWIYTEGVDKHPKKCVNEFVNSFVFERWEVAAKTMGLSLSDLKD
jgi:hypothetical protein